MSAELASIVGAKEGEKMSRSEIIKRLWAYLKKNNLQVLSYPLLVHNKIHLVILPWQSCEPN
jgi:hypothetical protein